MTGDHIACSFLSNTWGGGGGGGNQLSSAKQMCGQWADNKCRRGFLRCWNGPLPGQLLEDVLGMLKDYGSGEIRGWWAGEALCDDL